jgi:hypothetical protein
MVIWLFPGEKQEDQKYKITQTIGTAIGLAGEKKKKKTTQSSNFKMAFSCRTQQENNYAKKEICYVVLN